MSGVAVIRYLLANDSGVQAKVPSTRVIAGDLPLSTAMPAISVKQIDSMPYLTTRMSENKRMHTERVQVTIFVASTEASVPGDGYPGVKDLLPLVLAACANRRGTVNTYEVDSILPDVEGPDLFDEETLLYLQSRDFIVRYNA